MKRIFMLVVAVLFVNFVFAQYSQKSSLLQYQHNAVLNGLLQQSRSSSEAMRTTTGITVQRVIGQSTHDSTNAITDSINTNYTLYRTSTYDYNTMIYPYNYPYNTSPMFNNNAGVFTMPMVQFDTFNHWTIDPNTETYGYSETAFAAYNANYSMTGYVDLFADSVDNPNMLYTNKFNAAKNIDTAYWYKWQSGVADSAFKQFFTYNTSNLITKDSTYEYHDGVWRIASRSLYTYDGSNNLIEIDNYANTTDTSFLLPLIEQAQYINTYDASHRLLSVASSFYDGTLLQPYIRDTFAYSGAYAYHNAWREYQWDPINGYWAPTSNMTKTISTLGLPDTVTVQGFDSLLNSWVPNKFYVASYNSYKNPDTLTEYDYFCGFFPAKPSYTTVYYYNTFVNSTGVKNVVASSDDVKIFPNPAVNGITISGLAALQNTPVSVTLINASGQMVSRTSMLWQNETQISLGGLVPGVYWVMMQDDAGNMLHRQAVVKQ